MAEVSVDLAIATPRRYIVGLELRVEAPDLEAQELGYDSSG